LPPEERRVVADVTRHRALGFRDDGFEEMAARIDRLKNPPLRPYRERSHGKPPPDIFDQQRR